MSILKQLNKESFINNFIFSRHLIRKYLFKLSSSYTLPTDNIPSIIYKLFSFELSIPLIILFNNSSSIICPDMWKLSFIILLYKNVILIIKLIIDQYRSHQ